MNPPNPVDIVNKDPKETAKELLAFREEVKAKRLAQLNATRAAQIPPLPPLDKLPEVSADHVPEAFPFRVNTPHRQVLRVPLSERSKAAGEREEESPEIEPVPGRPGEFRQKL